MGPLEFIGLASLIVSGIALWRAVRHDIKQTHARQTKGAGHGR